MTNYVDGSIEFVKDASAPARAVAAVGVATAAPVLRVGGVDPESLRAEGRLLVLNASVCAAMKPELTAESERQVGPYSPVEKVYKGNVEHTPILEILIFF
jgi:hypothetical protein